MFKRPSIRPRLNLIRHTVTDVENGDGHVDDDFDSIHEHHELEALNSNSDTDDSEATMRAKRRDARTILGFIHRNGGYIFFAFVFFFFLRAGFLAGDNRLHINVGMDLSLSSGNYEMGKKATLPSSEAGWIHTPIVEHPISKLMDSAEERYRNKLAKQSTTLKAAVAEYKRRYGRSPPKGFDAWFAYAKKHDVKFVDEYDGLMEDLQPFRELSGQEIRRRTEQVGHLPSIDLVRIKDGNATKLKLNTDFEDDEVSARAEGFSMMIAQFAHLLPDMDFSINAKAEGRVLVPWEHRKYPNLTQQDSSVGIDMMLDGPFRPDWSDDGTVWEAWRRTCHPRSPARRVLSSLRNTFSSPHKNYLSKTRVSLNSPEFTFVDTTTAQTTDFCSNPHEHNNHGHFFSDWRTIPVLYPVFSPARAKGFMDIRIPSHYYYGSTPRYTYGWDPINLELHEVDKMEVPWNEKRDKVYWRGATTGGGNHPAGFSPQYQRHRFLRMASSNSTTPHPLTFAHPPSSPSASHYITTTIPQQSLNTEIMDTAFVKVVAAESYPGGLKALKNDHRFSSAVPLGVHWKYKYLLDIDGMGYSARFMAFLASDSVPVKMTVYEEFFSDWIEPWVHFIPLSSSYAEIYNIYAYFSGPPPSALNAVNSSLATLPTNSKERKSVEGDRKLKRIARAGKEWKKTVGRELDMEVYVYRLALEWARLWADDRDAMAFEL